MAYIRAHATTQRKSGKPVKRYEVVWTEPVRDEFGLPIPVNPARPKGRKKTSAHQESYPPRGNSPRPAETNSTPHGIPSAQPV